jgi:hypothetical protein
MFSSYNTSGMIIVDDNKLCQVECAAPVSQVISSIIIHHITTLYLTRENNE